MIAPLPDPNPITSWLRQALPSIPVLKRDTPRYDTLIGANFDPSWIKGARLIRRKEMVKPPTGINRNGASQVKHVRTKDPYLPLGSSLELDDWEKNIIMFSG